MSGDQRTVRGGKGTYVALVVLAALLGISLVRVEGQLVCKLIGDTFVSGYSASKGFAFLSFALLLCLARLLPLPVPRRLPLWVGLGVASCMLVSLMEHALFCYALGLTWTQRCWLSVDGEYSFHGLLHFHVSKAPIAWLSRYRGDALDSGAPFLALFADWLVVLHLALLLISAGVLLWWLRGLSFERPPGTFLTALIASVAVFKCTIDGGPLELEFLILAAPWLHALGGWRAVAAYLPLQVALLAYRLSFLGGTRLTVEGFHLATMVLVAGVPALVQSLWSSHRRSAWLVGILGLGALWGVLLWEAEGRDIRFEVPRAINLHRYGLTQVRPDQDVHLVLTNELSATSPDIAVRAHYRGKRMHLYALELKRPMSIYEICRLTGANLLRQPVSLGRTPLRTTVQGILFGEWPAQWPQSEMVLSSRWRGQGREVSLELDMRPGSNLNVLRDALPGPMFAVLKVQTVLAPAAHEDASSAGEATVRPRGTLRWWPGLRRSP